MSDEDVDRIFQALADATRRDIVSRVMAQALSVSELASGYAMSFAAVQKHVAVLERAGLVAKQRRGREQIVHGDPAALRRAARLLDDYEQIWRDRAARMESLITEDREGEQS
ncbi:Helix-turn-helix domain-containing protein [Paramicrobacterium humi]|uniref:Helix-turn-helix domain-containing protein n=2 Tax=Paramicrobacterium humi TaxID=640635 RepID=A0A1H4KUD5_9MICO|nr:Helix-turn-helix domain-containing protein [Microbacterium humi]